MSEKHTCKYLQFGKVYNSAILVKVTNVEHHLKCSNITFLILQLDLLSFLKIVSIVHNDSKSIYCYSKVWFHKFCYLCKRNILMAMSYVDCVLVLLNVIAFHTCPSVYVCLHMCISIFPETLSSRTAETHAYTSLTVHQTFSHHEYCWSHKLRLTLYFWL